MASLDGIEVLRLEMPLVAPFATAGGTRRVRTVVLVRVAVADGPDGWGECVAPEQPTYTAEWALGAHRLLTRHLIPRLMAWDPEPLTEPVGGLGGLVDRLGIIGNPMARAALVDALTDAELRNGGASLAGELEARESVVAGVALGQMGPSELEAVAGGFRDQGYRRMKVKIAPGADVEPLSIVRSTVGDDVVLVADANGSYDASDAGDVGLLVALDEWSLEHGGPGGAGLSLLEQPFAADDLIGHARLRSRISTPVCLDESISSVADVETAIAIGAMDVVCLKAGRVGGIWAAADVHDRCVEAGVGLYGGGMLETGIGRAQAVMVAALPGCDRPSDLSGSSRYWSRDLVVAPIEPDASGMLRVPDGPGNGAEVDLAAVDACCQQREWFAAH